MTMKLEQAARQALEALESVSTAKERGFGIEYAKGYVDPVITALREALAEQAVCKECGTKQAQIDRLMLEYCPDEMTTEQMREWGNNQQPAEQAEQEPVAWVDLKQWQSGEYDCFTSGKVADYMTPLYATPVRTKDLTDEEIDAAIKKCNTTDTYKYFRAVIAADRGKNK